MDLRTTSQVYGSSFGGPFWWPRPQRGTGVTVQSGIEPGTAIIRHNRTVSTESSDAEVSGSIGAARAEPRTARRDTMIVWAVALVGGALASFLSPAGAHFAWLSITLAGCCILTFVLQLLTHEKHGFINRVSIGITGAFLITALLAAIVGLATVLGG